MLTGRNAALNQPETSPEATPATAHPGRSGPKEIDFETPEGAKMRVGAISRGAHARLGRTNRGRKYVPGPGGRRGRCTELTIGR